MTSRATTRWSYQVVFSYRDDEERRLLVEQIETVTGLELE